MRINNFIATWDTSHCIFSCREASSPALPVQTALANQLNALKLSPSPTSTPNQTKFQTKGNSSSFTQYRLQSSPPVSCVFFFFFFFNKGFNSGKQKLYSSPGKKSIAWRWYCLRSSTLLRQHLFNNTSAGISHRGHQHLTGNDCNTLRITGSTSHPRKQKRWAFTSALAT